MQLITHINKIFRSISYIIVDEKDCWIVDVGDSNELLKLMSGLNLKGIFLTHCHYDHIYGLYDIIQKYTKTPIYTNQNGLKSLCDPIDNQSAFHDSPFIWSELDLIKIVKNNDFIYINNDTPIQAVYTPGHHPSCITWKFNNILFTGDAYIPGYKPYFKLFGGDEQQANQSFKLIKSLSFGQKILSGHEPLLNGKN